MQFEIYIYSNIYSEFRIQERQMTLAKVLQLTHTITWSNTDTNFNNSTTNLIVYVMLHPVPTMIIFVSSAVAF